jgi:hypothetical protein
VRVLGALLYCVSRFRSGEGFPPNPRIPRWRVRAIPDTTLPCFEMLGAARKEADYPTHLMSYRLVSRVWRFPGRSGRRGSARRRRAGRRPCRAAGERLGSAVAVVVYVAGIVVYPRARSGHAGSPIPLGSLDGGDHSSGCRRANFASDSPWEDYIFGRSGLCSVCSAWS